MARKPSKTLTAGYLALAAKLQEAAGEMMAGDICSRISDAISDNFRGSGTWAYYVNHSGTDTGFVIYSVDGDLKKATYALGETGGKATTTIDFATAKDVVPVTTYQEEVEESAPAAPDGKLSLVETCESKPDALALVESTGGGVRMPIKLIAPGKGSSAFYPAEVLKRDGPNVFTKGTHIYINHATAAEEAARPEGDWHKLVGALESNAYYDDNGKAGPGLYGMAVFTSYAAPLIKEKAPFTGMSIRASGIAEASRKQDGLPVLKEFTSAESIDVVTRAGAGGMILTEAARPGNGAQNEMTKEEIQALIAESNRPLIERALRGDAVVVANRLLSPLAMNEAAKQHIIENVIERGLPAASDGKTIDEKKLTELLEAEAKRVAVMLGTPLQTGLTASAGVHIAEADDSAEKRIKAVENARKIQEIEQSEAVNIFESLGLPKEAAKFAAKGRAA